MQLSIALYSDVLIEYFKTRPKFNKTFSENVIQSIIENPFNTVMISKNYLSFLESTIDCTSSYYNDFTNFITEIIDNNSKCKILNPVSSESIEAEFINLVKCCNVTNIALSFNSIDFGLTNHVCLKNYDNCIITRLLVNLVKDRKHISRYSDFNNQGQIINFFTSLFQIPKHLSSVVIFERYANVNHPYFDFFNISNIEVNYYKYNATLQDGNALKRKFNKVSLYNTSKRDLIHERTIIFDNFIVNLDEDPFSLDSSRKTWTISVEYSSKTVNNLKAKCIEFNKVNFV